MTVSCTDVVKAASIQITKRKKKAKEDFSVKICSHDFHLNFKMRTFLCRKLSKENRHKMDASNSVARFDAAFGTLIFDIKITNYFKNVYLV